VTTLNQIAHVVLLLFALLTTALSGVAAKADDSATGSRTLGEAVALIEREQGVDAVPILRDLAENGHARAQVMLGAAYSEGKWLPRDPLQAYVWLRIAATLHRGAVQQWAMLPKARELMLQAAGAVDGAGLIEGDARAAEFIRARNQAWDQSFQLGVRGQAGEEDPLHQRFAFRVGCAVRSVGPHCKASAAAAQPGCTGALEANADVKASGAGKSAKVFQPDYPGAGRRNDSHVGVLAHVDRSGWVCYVKVTDSSDDAGIDGAVVETLSQWRFAPATKAGEPVESLHTTYVTLKVNR
jgi:TonB family protein